jgi:hypothetical protein
MGAMTQAGSDPPPADAAMAGRRFPRGALVVVDDGRPFRARIVVAIGVVAVVVHRSEHAGVDVCSAVPVRCCRPVGDEPPSRGEPSAGASGTSVRAS